MIDFFQYLVAGLASGAVYGLTAVGLTVVLNTADTINVAHGESIVLGGAFVIAYQAIGAPLWLVAVLAILSVALISSAMAFGLILPLIKRGATPIALMMMTLGVSIVLAELIGRFWGKEPLFFEPFSGNVPIAIGGLFIQTQTIWMVAVTSLVAVLLLAFFRYTQEGRAMVACSIDRLACAVLGIRVKRMTILAFFLSGAVGGLAGVLVTPISTVTYTGGLLLVLKGFTAAVIGGLGSPIGALLGGIFVGVVEAMGAAYISTAYKDLIAPAVLLLVLMARPQGLMSGLLRSA